MNTNDLLILGAVGAGAVILLSKGKVGNYIGQSAGVAAGTAVTGAATGLIEGTFISPYKWAQQQEYIPIIDDIAKPAAQAYVWLRNLGDDDALFW